MRFIGVFIIAAVVLTGTIGRIDAAQGGPKGTITLSGAWALYPMAVKWAEEYQKLNPGVRIDISAGGAGKGMADALAGMVDIGMVSRAINPAEEAKGAWWLAVTKDAVVPVVNAKNPAIKELLMHGIKKEGFIGIWITENIKNWGALAGAPNKDSVHVYTRSDACGAAQTWAEYLGKKQEDLKGVGVYGDPGLAGAVKADPLGIGYNNINYAYDNKSLQPLDGLAIAPIDVNGDGSIGKDESFYSTRDDLVKAINDGRYPSPPARELYFVCKGKPEKEHVRQFLKWILTDGQKYVPETGYINLPAEKIEKGLKKL